MKHILKTCFLALFTFAALTARASAADEGTSGAQFLRIGADASAAALGDTGSAANGARAIFYNPAGLAGPSGTELYLSRVSWIGETTYSNLAFSTKHGASAYGLAVSYLSSGDIDKYDKYGNALSETYSERDMAVTLGYAAPLGKAAGFGVNAKFISSRLEAEYATALALDAGLRYSAIPGRLDFGFAMQNMGPGLKYVNSASPLPLNFRLGGKYTLSLEKARQLRKSAAFFADINHQRDAGFCANTGVEFETDYEGSSSFALRAGYKTGATGDSSGISAGIGLNMKSYLIDYAYAPMGDLGNTHRISLTMLFGAAGKAR